MIDARALATITEYQSRNRAWIPVFTPGAGALLPHAPWRDPAWCAAGADRKTPVANGSADRTALRPAGAVLGILTGPDGRRHGARAFDTRVISYDPEVPKQLADEAGAELVDLDSLLKESDVITLHALLNEQTRGILNRDRLRLVKRGAVLVNLARGGLVESLDVIYEALNSGQLSAVD